MEEETKELLRERRTAINLLRELLGCVQPSDIHHYGGLDEYERFEDIFERGWAFLRLIQDRATEALAGMTPEEKERTIQEAKEELGYVEKDILGRNKPTG